LRCNQANRCWRRQLRMGKQGEALNPFPHTHTTHTAPRFTTRSGSLCTFLGARHRLCGDCGLTENCVHLNSPPHGRVHMRHRMLAPPPSSYTATHYTHALPTPIHPPHPIYHTDSVGEDSVFLPACLPARTYAAALSSSYPSRRLGTKQPDRHATPPPPHHHQQQ